MKRRAYAAVAVATLVTIALACSSRSSQPPIDTSGGTVPEPGGGQPATGNDAGVVAADAGAIDAGDAGPAEDAANNCHFGSCAGCCSSPASGGQCLQGQTDDQCGLNGVGCQACDAGAHCINGTCL